MDDLSTIRSEALGAVQQAADLAALDAARVAALGKKGSVTGLMKTLGYGAGYKYAHDYAGHRVEQQHLPDELVGERFYEPGDQGYERTIAARPRSGKPQS